MYSTGFHLKTKIQLVRIEFLTVVELWSSLEVEEELSAEKLFFHVSSKVLGITS